MKTLNQDMKKKTFRPVYLLYGEEAFLVRSYKRRLTEAIIGEDTMNYSYFEGKGLNVKEIFSLADTLPFFAEKRLIVLENSGLLKKDGQELADYLPNMPETTCILLAESEVDKRSKLFKRIKELGHPAEMKKQPEKELKRWVAGFLDKSGIQITEEVAAKLIQTVGDDMFVLSGELDKLASYLGDRNVVLAEDVEVICTNHIENRIFDMITYMAAQDQKKALDLYADLAALREPPMRILYLIGRQYHQLLQARELFGQGLDRASVAKQMGLAPFIAGKIEKQASRYTVEELKQYVASCVNTEEAVKTGRIADNIGLELLIVECSGKEQSGQAH